MLKRTLLWASTNPFLAERLPRYRFVRRAVRRFMPGEHMEDALHEAERLEGEGMPTLLTALGEDVETDAEIATVVQEYRALAAAVAERGLDAELSLKLSHLGLDRDLSATAARVVEIARATGGTLWIDMERSTDVDRTLELFRAAHQEVENLGICLQAYLHRTPGDYEALLPLRPAVRLVKGAYLEPPEVAIPEKAGVDEAYTRLAARMLRDRKEGRLGRPCLGTHDLRIVREAIEVADRVGLDRGAWEVAMLYGIGTEAQRRLRREGVTLRVLISYGTQWWPWYVRRLAERPANVGFLLRQIARR